MPARSPPRLSGIGAIVGLAAASGCAGSYTLLQPAQTLAPGELQVVAGATIPLAGAAAREALQAGGAAVDGLAAAANDEEPATDELARESFEAALAAALFQPAVQPELMLRVGLVEHVDAGLRWGGPLLKLDGKWQFHDDAIFDLALDGSYAYHLSPAPSFLGFVPEVLEYVKLGDYSQHDFELALIGSLGMGEVGAIYGGLRGYVSPVSIDEDLGTVEALVDAPQTTLSDVILGVGGTIGVKVGWRYAYLLLEANVLYLHFQPTILGEVRDLSGPVLAPAIALAIEP